jgi:hypothetical protein
MSIIAQLFHRCSDGEVIKRARVRGERSYPLLGLSQRKDAFIFIRQCACGKKYGELAWVGDRDPCRIDADLAESYIKAYGLPEAL